MAEAQMRLVERVAAETDEQERQRRYQYEGPEQTDEGAIALEAFTYCSSHLVKQQRQTLCKLAQMVALAAEAMSRCYNGTPHEER
ncbi:hypothetical protein ETH_00017555 [Eimeria tenella]|uniref:Uncharacterized protein n=1 Tax=Eimeria tenella TaxID=5802 RepID=U6L8S9_EIMTE|nr:hypothetical protein ETH_00017555 [Eimeria tenella]CDJ44205.1 hypothetical protein ETH_00017555 [Eimeria tenella]|eukprot:XP_013234954.1 hypothetical protein ETH_00017555 [Eimeria tenella]